MTDHNEHAAIGAPTGRGKAERSLVPNMPRPQLPFEFPPMLGQKAARYDFIVGWLLGRIADGEESISAESINAMQRQARQLYPIRGEYVG